MIYYIIEAFIVFFSFFLPGYLIPPLNNPNEFLNSYLHMSIYIILSFLQIIFMIYILFRDKNIQKQEFGLIKPQFRDVIHALLFSLGLYAIYFLMVLIISNLPETMQEIFIEGFRWQLENKLMIPLLFLFCLTTGYREELLFRSYIITRCSQISLPIPYAIMISVFSFSILHLYEGITGFLFTLFSGVYLSILFIVKKNIHIIAISHGIFNFCSLLLTLIVQE